MGQIRHGSATTTHAVRAALQRSQASLATVSKEFGGNRGHFPSDEAAAKLIYLALNATSSEWKRSVSEWYAVRCQLAIMFEDRFPMA